MIQNPLDVRSVSWKEISYVGVPQKFTGFTSSSQFWRIRVISNHGGQCTCFQAVEFNGADQRIIDLFQRLNLQKYTDPVIKSVSFYPTTFVEPVW